MIALSDKSFKIGLALAALSLLALPIALQAKDAEPVQVEKPESFKGVSQVVIGQFTVGFFTKKVDYDGGGFLAAGNKGKAVGELTGVSASDFQRVTDAIYDDFVKQMAARGITVADASGLTASKYYAKVKPEMTGDKFNVPLKKDDKADALAFWPSQLGRNNNMIMPLRMMDMNMSNMYTAEYDFARSAKTPVVNILYIVDFAKPAKSTGGGLFQNIAVKAGLAVSPFGTQMQMMDTNGKVAKIILKTPVEEAGDFANINETTSGVTKAMRVASVLGSGFGLGKPGAMSARFDYEVVDAKVYSEKAQEAATKVSDLFIRQMEALR